MLLSSRFARRCLLFLLLAAVGGGFLARPAEAGKRPFADIVDSAARRHGVDPGLVHAVIAVESGYRASAQSPAGAQGLMQLMPGTQRDLGVADAFDPGQNVDAGVAYLRRLTDEFGTELAIAAYNAGPGAVRRYRGIPPYEETRAYVRTVLDQAGEEHVPSRGRTHAISEAGLAEPVAVDRPAQDDHLALDGEAGLEPRALDLDDRAATAATPDQPVNPRGTPAGALRQRVADERPIQDRAGSTHAAADTARLVLHHGADRLGVGADLRYDGSGLPVLAAIEASNREAQRRVLTPPVSNHSAPVDLSPPLADRGEDQFGRPSSSACPYRPANSSCAWPAFETSIMNSMPSLANSAGFRFRPVESIPPRRSSAVWSAALCSPTRVSKGCTAETPTSVHAAWSEHA